MGQLFYLTEKQMRPYGTAMAHQDEYEGPQFTAHDGDGNDYVLTPVYRRREDSTGSPIGNGYEIDDLVRIWTAGGGAVRREGPGRYTILSSRAGRDIIVTSRDAKAI